MVRATAIYLHRQTSITKKGKSGSYTYPASRSERRYHGEERCRDLRAQSGYEKARSEDKCMIESGTHHTMHGAYRGDRVNVKDDMPATVLLLALVPGCLASSKSSFCRSSKSSF